MEDLVKIGIEKGDTVLVHSSLSSIGYIPGGAETLVDALIETVGEGTVVVPTITGQISDSPEYPPSFYKDKPCWTGVVPETLRKREEAYRSIHPTHSVAAIGRMARKITEGHEDAETPCGKGSPYLKISELDGKILFIGTSLESSTILHSVEELARLYYHMQPEPSICKINVNGKQVEKKFFLHAYGTPRSFEKEDELVKNEIAKISYIGRARSILVNARKINEYTLEKINEDRLYLVKKDYVDLWSISSSIILLEENKFKTMKINLYVPKSATVRFFDNRIAVSGVKMNLYNLNLISGVLELPSKIEKRLYLKGGYNYWLIFKKVEKGIKIEELDFKKPDSFF